MNKNFVTSRNETGRRGNGGKELILFSIVLLTLWVARPPARAEIPEPDNVLYGTIALDNVPVTAARTDVIVEARRVINGPAVARYRMGSNPQAGHFYSLRVKLESIAPVLDPDASLAGASLFIVVRDASGVRDQVSHTVAERGQVQRLDFGGSSPDADGDGLPDGWEILHFGNTGSTPDMINANGQTTLRNYIAGTNPNDTNSVFRVSIRLDGASTLVSFQALSAQGIGYEGRSRFYSLEYTPGIGSGWQGVPDFTNLLGNNQTIQLQFPSTNSPLFYRGNVQLQGP